MSIDSQQRSRPREPPCVNTPIEEIRSRRNAPLSHSRGAGCACGARIRFAVLAHQRDCSTMTLCGTQEGCLSRSRAWPELNEQETNDSGSTTHRIRTATDRKKAFSNRRTELLTTRG